MPTAPQSSSLARSRARRDQLLACVLGALFLAIAIGIRPLLTAKRALLVNESQTSLRSLAVAFPRLTLGGFRGLVATILWIQAEDDKTNRKWQDLETKYDIIGALQPYFSSVYIFHAWNQAYNISAQWHDQDNKYKWVLDGLSYLNKGEDYNPQNTDILVEQGNMYFLKLGGSFERIFYRAHWRDDISKLVDLEYAALPQGVRTDSLKLVRDDVLRVSPENRAAYDKTHDPIERQKLRAFHTAPLLDPSGRTTRTGYGVSIIAPELFDLRTDGKPAADPMPFRYGLSPYYFAYAQFVRVGMIVKAQHVIPTNMTMRVLDAWPAMSVRLWCRDDLFYSQKKVADMFCDEQGKVRQLDFADPATRERFQNDVAEVRDCYRNVQMLAPKSVAMFERHIRDFPINKSMHAMHILETNAYQAIGKAESSLFEALLLWQGARYRLTDEVAAKFAASISTYEQAEKITTIWVDFIAPSAPGKPMSLDRTQYEAYINALNDRRRGIEILLSTQPSESASLDFLSKETVER